MTQYRGKLRAVKRQALEPTMSLVWVPAEPLDSGEENEDEARV